MNLMTNTFIKDSEVKQEFVGLVSSLLKSRFNFTNETDKNIIAPLRYGLMQPNTYLRFVEDKVSDIRTVYKIYILTESEDKILKKDLDDFEGNDISLRLIIDNDSVKLDYNFFTKKGDALQSKKEHLEYRIDQFKKQIVSSNKIYDARYHKSANAYFGSVNYVTGLKEYTLEDDIKTSKVMEYKTNYSNRDGSEIKREALIDSMPTATNGTYTIITKLTTNQAVVYKESGNDKSYSLVDIDDTDSKEFRFSNKSCALDEEEAKYVLKRYSIN